MPTEMKNSTAKASRSGSVSEAACWLSADSESIMRRKRRRGRTTRRTAAPRRRHSRALMLSTARRNSSRDRGGDVVQYPRNDAAADHQHDGDEGGNLGNSDRQRGDDLAASKSEPRCVLQTAVEGWDERRQQHQRQYHGEIFDDQPADGDASALRVEDAAPAGRGAAPRCWRRTERGRRSRRRRSASRANEPQPDAEHRRHRDLHDGAGPRACTTDPSRECRPTPNIRRMTPESRRARSASDLGRRRSRA